MNERKLYFVRADKHGFCIFGGHWYAPSPSKAIELAKSIYSADGGETEGTVWFARKSKSFANALNAEEAA